MEVARSTRKGKAEALAGPFVSAIAAALLAEVRRAVANAMPISQDEGAWIEAAKADVSASTVPAVAAHRQQALAIAEAEVRRRVHARVWPDPLPRDYFAGRDWHVVGKNVWILQVGSKAEYGDYETFKARVSGARVGIDDTGELECSYDAPRPDGGFDRLSLDADDGGRFQLDGAPLQTDLYPRFETPFIRGGRVEWGQREYVIEHGGKLLLHDLSDFDRPRREEAAPASARDRNTVKALVIFVRTDDEDMDAFTVATAQVTIGCSRVAADEVVAVGPMDEDTRHDAEWIFLDAPAERQPDMTLSLTHPPSSEGDATPHWKMSFTLFALMGDRILRPCSVAVPSFDFEDGRRATGPIPFSIALREWRPWTVVTDKRASSFWSLAKARDQHRDGHNLFLLGEDGRFWHQRLGACSDASPTAVALTSPPLANAAGEPVLRGPFLASAASPRPGDVRILVQSGGALFARRTTSSGTWTEGWIRIAPWRHPQGLLGLGNPSGPPVPIALSPASPIKALPAPWPVGGLEAWFLGADQNFYTRNFEDEWDAGPWQRIRVTAFSPLLGAEFEIIGDTLFALAEDRSLWAGTLDESRARVANWDRVGSPGSCVIDSAAAFAGGAYQVVALTPEGLGSTTHRAGSSLPWSAIPMPSGTVTARLAVVSVDADTLRVVVLAEDGRLHSMEWRSVGGWDSVWAEIDALAASPTADRLAAVSRVPGLVEVFAAGAGGPVHRTWWS